MPSSRGFRTRLGAIGGGRAGSLRGLEPTAATVALVGAVMLVVAEFTSLYSLQLITSGVTISRTSTGAHDSYALIPIAVLAAVLALTAGRPPRPAALAAIAVLGILTLVIALVGDLPDARAQGLTRRYALAATTPGPGLYLETFGAVVLLLSGAAGLLTEVWTRARERGGRREVLPRRIRRPRSES